MYDRNYNVVNPAEEILSYLKANKSGCQSFRRRAVIYKSGDAWILQACVVEGVSENRKEVKIENPRCYSNVVLWEDWLLMEEIRDFVEHIQQGRFALGKYLIGAATPSRQWTRERQPLSNDYMSYAGYVWSLRFHDEVFGVAGELLSPMQPYYPDMHEAIKDWLPYPVYQHRDSRKGEIILLLPETRAYFSDAVPYGNSIDLHIAGAEADNLSLEVKGAWWGEEGIHHFSENVSGGRAQLNVPVDASRLDYVLVDSAGVVYDFQQEDGYRHTGLGRKLKTKEDRTLANMVREACQSGEGQKIEFKPFIDSSNRKLVEVVRTVVAFANTQGGRIFLGINDGCEVEGIDVHLRKRYGVEVDESVCVRYLGEIRSGIRDELRSDVKMEFGQVTVDGVWIAVVSVAEADDKPVTIQQDKSLYIRRGASNVKASPEEWKAIISSPGGAVLAPWMRNR